MSTYRRSWRRSRHALPWVGVVVGLTLAAGVHPIGAAERGTGQSASDIRTASAAATQTDLTLDQWKQMYEHDIGILADDLLVVVDDGKRAQKHVTKAKVKLTLKDCRQWGSDAALAEGAAPPIPLPAAERAWTSLMHASGQAAAQCVAALQRGVRGSAAKFRRQLAIAEKDEATLVTLLNG